ncbi:IS1634 family transposase [Sedimentisphaera salicampi]|uniref:Transposase n=1 Tax=Sedimentisphaera salicampi TaxID=1941349 RepID=A0A1W6LPS8_9BACT|nr:IS1634 family transposase [Sedimentisphaera salicampi]ARN56784.1 Transposase [Sedimentisphaera salicampi]ARN57565.1 Transposase [Sedimentisphaera salicampi]ARN57767.1 Transposase [Sedimentisphaera salicampi]
MFIRVKKSKNSPKRSVQIVASYRNEKNQPRQRIVRHMGTAFTEEDVTRLKDLAEFEKAKLEAEITPALFKPEQLAEAAIEARKKIDDEPINVNLKDIKEQARITTGIHEVFGSIYDELGFNNLFDKRKEAARRNLRHITMARLANPVSKRGSVQDLSKDFGISLSLDSVYRMMDNITDDIISKAQNHAHKAAKGLLGEEINLLFYDCTTLYFESFTEDELKKNGYSKDMKFNQPQVVLGLLSTSEGLPVGYEVFPGNQYEGHTLHTVIPKIKEKYNLKRVIFTADSAMLSKANLDYLEEQKVEYIVAARLKSLTDQWKAKITESVAPLRSFDYGKNRRLIVTYSDKLAKKNKHDRDEAIRKLREKLEKSSNPKSLISNYGYKKFMRVTGEVNCEINEEKYAQAAKFDGLHGVITNVKDMDDSAVVEHYKQLWLIEECFRISKHELKIRPIYHWTPKRIKAHILICFIALTCARNLAYRVRLRFEAMSVARMVNALNHVQLSILWDKKSECKYVLPSKINEDARKLYKTVNLSADTTPYKM